MRYHEILTCGDDRIDPIIWEKGVSFKDCLEGLLLYITYLSYNLYSVIEINGVDSKDGPFHFGKYGP